MMRGSGMVLENVLSPGKTSVSRRCLTASALHGVDGKDGSESCKIPRNYEETYREMR